MFSPAARLTDMHACPMQTPAVVPIPHVGGPIVSQGASTVFIAGLPAARVGDICICVGPPAPIVMGSLTVLIEGSPAARVGDMTGHGGAILPPGCPTVLIGDAGGGAGSPAAATMSAARASAAAFTRMDCATEGLASQTTTSAFNFVGDPTKKSWVEIELFDQKNSPVAHQRFRVVPPGEAAKPIDGFLDDKGFARIAGIDPGICKITFPDLDASSWKPVHGDLGKRTKPEPPVVPVKPPGVRATSVILEVAVRPPGIKAATVTLATIIIPPVITKRPSVQASTVTLAVVGRAPKVNAASVQLRVVSGRGAFVAKPLVPTPATVSWDSQTDTAPGDQAHHTDDLVTGGT